MFSYVDSVVLGMPDIEVFGILKIACKLIDGQQTARKFNFKLIWMTSILNYRTHIVEDHRPDSMGTNQRNIHLKLNKNKWNFRCLSVPMFGEVISQDIVRLDPRKSKVLTNKLPPNWKKEFQLFLAIISYLTKFSPATVDVCELLRKLTSVKV